MQFKCLTICFLLYLSPYSHSATVIDSLNLNYQDGSWLNLTFDNSSYDDGQYFLTGTDLQPTIVASTAYLAEFNSTVSYQPPGDPFFPSSFNLGFSVVGGVVLLDQLQWNMIPANHAGFSNFNEGTVEHRDLTGALLRSSAISPTSSFVVSAAVPLPSTIWTFNAALVTLAGLRISNRRGSSRN